MDQTIHISALGDRFPALNIRVMQGPMNFPKALTESQRCSIAIPVTSRRLAQRS